MDEDRNYDVGDLVEIVTPNEFRERGGNCTDDCAIALYAGSVCEITTVCIPGVKLSPVRLIENFPLKYPNQRIEEYSWNRMSIKRYEGDIKSENETDFDEVFA